MNARKCMPYLRTGLFLGVWAISGATLALDRTVQTQIGEEEYQRSCAACHGAAAKGDGPVAEVLTQAPPDLTQISKRNDGNFPIHEIYHMIDGEGLMGPHGSKEMPVWGDRYRAEAIGQMAGVPHDLRPEVIVHGRILSLVYYLQSIQR